MRYTAPTAILVLGTLLVAGLDRSPPAARAADAKTAAPAPAAPPDANRAESKLPANSNAWRYVRHGGQWWYWLPEKRWIYWQGDRWNNYVEATAAVNDASPSPQAGRPVRLAIGDRDEVQPYYEHAQSRPYGGPSRQEEIGPYYGNALPRDVFGTWFGPRRKRGQNDFR